MATTKRLYSCAQTRSSAVAERGRLWVENQDPASRRGATIGWWKRYQAADGQLFAVLLAAYFFLTIVPLMLVYTSYAYSDPAALAKRIDHRLGLGHDTAQLFKTVMVGSADHKLTAALIAIINLFFFGLGFGRVLQLVHARSWGLDLRKRAIADQLLYFEALAGLAILALLYVLQTKALRGEPSWIGWLLDPVWLVVLAAFFTWMPRLLLERRIAARDILPGAVFTVAGFVALRLISVVLLKRWLEWYSRTYGGFGFVMAAFFWLILFATVMVLSAALSPALADRRALRAAAR
jgi:uncharacterized BrkB/YihY/UPF0761 family membrane protein